MGGATREPSDKEERPNSSPKPEVKFLGADTKEASEAANTFYVPQYYDTCKFHDADTSQGFKIANTVHVMASDSTNAVHASNNIVESDMDQFEPSIVSGTHMTHGEKDNIELLGEVYHLVHGGALSNISEDHFSNLTQTRTPALGNTMLHIAALYGSNEVVDLVAKRAPNLLFWYNSNDDTPLHVAARAGHISTVQKLLEAYTDEYGSDDNKKPYMPRLINFIMMLKNNQGNIMLHEAMMSRGSVGANIFQVFDDYVAKNNKGRSRSESCFKVALNNINNANQSVLYLAVEAGLKKTVIRILDKECNKNVTPQGISPLVAAIMKQDKDMLSTILDKRQEWMHLKDTKHGRIPLHYAACTGYREGVVELLKKCKSCSNAKDEYGFFPLHLASHGGHVEVVQELLKYCPDPVEMLDKSGRNILHIAARNGKYKVVQYILRTPELEGTINQKDVEGNTPLHLASKWCHPKTVYALTWDERVKPSLGLVNQHKQTPLDIVNSVYQSQKGNPSLHQRLTWIALKSAGAKASSRKVVPPPVESSPSNSKPNEAKVEQTVYNTKPYKDRVDTLQVVSTLIVTASVAACLAVPGEAEGEAKNLHHAMFSFFVFSITISLFSSISATIILFWTRLGVVQLLAHALDLVMPLLGVALISLCLAFMAGLYTVISKLTWLATTFLVVTLIFVVVVFFLYTLLFLPSKSTNKLLRYFSYYPFIYLASLGESRTHHRSHNL